MPKDKSKVLAAGYCRVSTDAQASEGESLKTQHAEIKRYCQYRGFELTRILYRMQG